MHTVVVLGTGIGRISEVYKLDKDIGQPKPRPHEKTDMKILCVLRLKSAT